MSMIGVAGIVFAFFCICLLADNRAENARIKAYFEQHRRQIFFHTLHNSDVATELAKELMLENEDGCAAEHVQCAIDNCWRRADGEKV